MNPSTASSVASLGNIGRWAVAPLLYRSFTSIQMVHTHTPCRSRVDEMKMSMKWGWRWDDSYLTGTQDGERKRKEEKKGENTNTTHLARSGRTLKRQGKRKADGRRAKHQPAEGGEDESAWHNLQGESHAYLGTRRTPTWPNTGARNTWNRGPMGT